MLQLYDLNHNKIAPLLNYKDLKRERDTVKGDDILSFSYPKKEANDIKQECYIRTKENEYVIKEVENSDPNWITIKAKVNTEGLKSKIFSNFEVVNSYISDALNLSLVGTGWSIGHNDITRRRTVRKSNSTSLEVIEEIRSVYQAEIYFDALLKKINVFESRGADHGEFFIEKLNLKELSISSDSYNYVTRLIPVGKDGLTITDINDGKSYVENYQYSSKIIYAVWEDNRYEDAQNLKDDAIKKLEENSQPYRSYQASVTQLDNVDLGDTVTLISKDNKVKEKQRVVKITQYLKEPWKDTVEIANKIEKFEVQQAKIRDAANTVESITTSDGMLDDSKINFDPIRQEFQTIVSEYALFTDLQAAVATLGTVIATKLEATEAYLRFTEIDTAILGKADVAELNAINTRTINLEADVAIVNTFLSKQVFVELGQFGQILAGSSIIAQGAIGTAQISDLSASKLSAGIADLAIVTIQGTDGRLKIANNLLQVFAGTTTLFERIALGDVNGDGTVYGLRIRGVDGTTVLFDENGQTKEGFTDGYNKLTDNSLNPAKLDIAQVVTRINNGTTTIDSSKIYMDDKTLKIAFSEISNTVISQGETITSQGSSISALNNAIILKVDTQTYDTKMYSLDGSINTINSTLSTQSSSISVLQGQIATKVTQTEIDNSINAIQVGGRNLFLNSAWIKDMTGWANAIIDTTEKHGSTNSLLSALLSSGTRDTYSNTIPVIEGEVYTVSYWIKSSIDLSTMSNMQSFFILYGGVTTYPIQPYGNLVAGVWKKIIHTTTIPVGKTSLRYSWRNVATSLASIWISEPKLEKGNKATDWTPAPEDVQVQIDNVTTRITSAESTITQHSTDISLRVLTSTYTSGLATKEATIYKQSSAPSHSNGRLWLDTSVTPNQLKRSTGSAWVKATPSTASEVGAYSASEGGLLASRVSTAELKITDSAIVSTVRTSSLYISDLDNKVSSSEIISEINQSAEVIKIQASKINLVGAVTVLSDIAGNLGTITAGDITGVTITGSVFTSNYVGSDAYKLWTGSMSLDEDALTIIQAEVMNSGAYPLFTKEVNYKIDGIYYEVANPGMGYGNYSFDNTGMRWVAEGGGESEDWFRASIERVSGLGVYDDLSIVVQSGGSLLLGSEASVKISAPYGIEIANNLQIKNIGSLGLEIRSTSGGITYIDFSRNGSEDYGVRLAHESSQRLGIYGHVDVTGEFNCFAGITARGNYGQPLILRGNSSGTANAVYMGFCDHEGVRHGYIGFGSGENNNLTLANERGGGALLINNGVVDVSALSINGLRIAPDEAPSTYNLDTLYTMGTYWFGDTAIGRPTSYGIVEVKIGCGGFVWNGYGN